MVHRAAGAQITTIASGYRVAEMLDGGRNSKESPMTRRNRIFANLLLTLPTITGLLVAAPSASAQSNKMNVTVPFAFSVGTQHMAAGSYSVTRTSDCFLLVQNKTTSRAAFLMVRAEDGSAPKSGGHLTFQRGGRGMYLTQAWFAGEDRHVRTVAKPKRDVEYAKQIAPAEQIEIASK
jgi:hypothetical protein